MKASPSNNYLYNGNLLPLAKDLRKRMTKAEACLWKYVLKAGNIKGYGFTKQRPILNYIADFACLELMLIIEVDGLTHFDDEAEAKDAIRQKHLEEVGFKVIRYYDDEVLNDKQNVIRSLLAVVDDREVELGLPKKSNSLKYPPGLAKMIGCPPENSGHTVLWLSSNY